MFNYPQVQDMQLATQHGGLTAIYRPLNSIYTATVALMRATKGGAAVTDSAPAHCSTKRAIEGLTKSNASVNILLLIKCAFLIVTRRV